MPTRQRNLQTGDSCCIGILLEQCIVHCHRCWYANEKREPTLISITTFTEIKMKRNLWAE